MLSNRASFSIAFTSLYALDAFVLIRFHYFVKNIKNVNAVKSCTLKENNGRRLIKKKRGNPGFFTALVCMIENFQDVTRVFSRKDHLKALRDEK